MVRPASFSFLFGAAWKIAVLLAIVICGKIIGDWLLGQFIPPLTPATEPALHRLIMTTMAAYILFMSLPFVPGVEIGLGVIATLGPNIAPLVYFSTVLALTISFLMGRFIPQETIIRFLEWVKLKRIAALLHQLQPLDTDSRLRFLLQNSSNRIVPYLLRYRFLALIVALNLPGNAILGGGGGICMIAGFCRLFTITEFLLATSIAVAPVPWMIYFGG